MGRHVCYFYNCISVPRLQKVKVMQIGEKKCLHRDEETLVPGVHSFDPGTRGKVFARSCGFVPAVNSSPIG